MATTAAIEQTAGIGTTSTSKPTNDADVNVLVEAPENGCDHEFLHVVDSRTSKSYQIPISDHFVLGADLGKITCPPKRHLDGGLEKAPERTLAVLDPGFQHTACKESGITYMYVVKYVYLI